MLQRVQRLINIKIAKAYRTVSFEASCMMAGVPLIGIVIEEKARLYKIKHSVERCEYECDIPLRVKEWPHPARRLNIVEIKRIDTVLYRNLYRRRQSRSRSGNICGLSAEKAVQIQVTKLLFKQSSRTNSNLEVTERTNIPFRSQRKNSSHLHR